MTKCEVKALTTFADMLPHPEAETNLIITSILRCDLKFCRKLMRRLIDNGYIIPTKRVGISEMKNYVLTLRGDQAFRYFAIELGAKYRYYKYAERTAKSAQKYWD